MSIRPVHFAALAFAASALMACASGSKPAETSPTPAAAADKATSTACTLCKVEVENRYDFVAMVFDRRDTRAGIGTIQPLGKVQPKASTIVQVKGRPNLGMALHEDTGTPPTPAGLKSCRQTATRPETGADYRYTCGN